MGRRIIVAYHAVESDAPSHSRLEIQDEALVCQARYFAERGFEAVTFAESERRLLREDLERDLVVFTFDDGYVSTLRAKAILGQFGFPATVFVVTSFIGSDRHLQWPGLNLVVAERTPDRGRSLNWHELEDLAVSGWEIGSHTATHPFLLDVSDNELYDELSASRAAIARRMGYCETLAYPFGRADSRVAAAAEAAGYLAACTLTGTLGRVETRYLRQRVGLFSSDTGTRLTLKMSRPGLAARGTCVARAISAVRPRRSWLPDRMGQLS